MKLHAPVLLLACLVFAVPASSAPLSAAELRVLYAHVLHREIDDDAFEALHSAHQLLEEFFAAADTSARQEVIQQLAALELDPNDIGRLCRIRLNWPQFRPGVYYVNEPFQDGHVHYFLGVPRGYDRTAARPLVIHLPTADAFVTDPPPTANRVAEIYTTWIADELSRRPESIVLMPLLNLDELYGPGYAGMLSVTGPMQHAFDRVHLDPRQIYLSGHGMSAHAVWNLALHYPTYFAAVAAMAGQATEDWQRLRLPNLRNVLPVVWHDGADLAVPVRGSRDLVRILRQHEVEVEYEETRGVGHAPSPAIADRVYARMRARQRELYPDTVWLQTNRPDPIFRRADWVQLIEPMDLGRGRRMTPARGSGHFIVHDHPARIDATITAPNQIEVTLRNVESFRLLLNEQLVDPSRPVRVTVNGRVMFDAPVSPSIETMLQDQIFLGRGWRYYTAVIEIGFQPNNR